MSDFSIDPFLLIRAPAYSYGNFNQQFLEKVLKTDFFRASIFFASQSLFVELKKKDFDYHQISPQAKVTLWKYLNRMCFRSLPYGSFSSWSAAGWAEDQGDGLAFNDHHELVIHPDYKVLFNYINSLQTEKFPSVKYYTNNSLYQTASKLRFISQAYSAQNKFAIVELKLVPGLNKLLRFIGKGQTLHDIFVFLKEEYGDQAPVYQYFRSLLEGQVIVSGLTPSVTGPQYNVRCKSMLDNYTEVDHQLLNSFTAKFNSHDQSLPDLNEHIRQLINRNIENATYTLYQRNISGGARHGMQSELLSLLDQMNQLTADQELDTMSRFKTEFLQKYDQREMPLMIVLDPGCGIGYENLATAFDNQSEDFIDDIRSKEERQTSASWGPVEKMLFKKWNSLRRPGFEKIMINPEDLADLPKNGQPLPPGMFILFRSIDEEIWLDNIGGVSGIELSGRFAASGTEAESCLKKICEQEIAINNDFLFAEIAYSPNDRASNINQRGHFYAYEIPVLTHATLTEKYSIKLNDLVISVRDNRIFLRSVSLNKYIIPRLSSAYNYRLSTIPIIRFLCDLQFQGTKSNLSFSLANLFPGMEYYPRVQLGNAVVSPATWILNENQLKKIVEEDGFSVLELNIPEHFSLHEGDNFLVFNQHSKDDFEIFKKSVKGKKTVTLMEHVYAKNANLKDAEGRPYASQLLACAINQTKSYHLPMSQILKSTRDLLKVKRSFLPGQEWIYIKIYAHYSLTNEILINLVLPVVKKYKKDNPGFKWFFIRYEDHGHHLRLRFFTGGKPCHALQNELIHKFHPWSKEGKIADVILDTYQRELEKYSPVLIDAVESFFYRDSEFILSAFKHHELSSSFKLSFAVHTSLQLIHYFVPDKTGRNNFLNDVLNNVSAEFSREKEVVRKLDVKYRNFQKELISYGLLAAGHKKQKTSFYYEQLLEELNERTLGWGSTKRYNLLINLVHMHINRIFEHNSREYEYLVYHFMKKHQAYLNYTTSDVS
ncbi:lantibiotic dehydratase [Pedobacter sp. L105]|uniref:lantibiotic dehydratase n=1 Tax=Pedobacter sp. L105 TaxID=1641871 RepID=UPI00131AEC47|nr:lantibiotic dehydratase [Pedobacter sp. L105]